MLADCINKALKLLLFIRAIQYNKLYTSSVFFAEINPIQEAG